MTELILQTKLHIPQVRPSLIPRPRLIAKLDAGLAGNLTLVSAPPGFGKTTIVAEWLDQLPPERSAAWLSLEEGDNDPARFFAYLIGALQKVNESIGQAFSLAQLPPPEALMGLLINEIAAVTQPFVLVLDDYHLIITPNIQGAVAYLIEHMPPHLHLVIISRADPPFSISRLRVRRQLNEIRARDLRFTTAEAALFLSKTMDLNLSADEIALLEQRTEGWAAGLQLAAHSLQFEHNKLDFLTAFAGDDRYIADYLVEEVINHQPQEIQSFLLQTSILDRLNSQLCNAVLQKTDSQALLEHLEQSNLFILPLDNRRQWYRYHHLFADLLRGQLEISAVDSTLLHQRASQWYAEHSLLAQAVEHDLAAADFERAIQHIISQASELFMTNRLSTLLRWWQQIPEAIAAQDPQFCMGVAWAWLATGEPQESEHCLKLVENALGATTDALMDDIDDLEPAIRNGLIEVATIRLNFQSHVKVGMQETLALCRRVLPFLVAGGDDFLFNPAIALRPVILFNMGLAYQALNRLEEALTAFEDAINLGKSLGNGHIVALAFGQLAEVLMIQGRLNQAEETCEQGIKLLETMAGKITPISGLLHVSLGKLNYEWNNLETALEHFQEGIKLALPWRYRATLLPGYLGLVIAYRTLEWAEEAQSALEEFAILIGDEATQANSVEAGQYAWLLARHGEQEPARRWADNVALKLDQESLPEEQALLLVRMRTLFAEFEGTSQWLSTLRKSAESGGRWGRVIEIAALQTMIYDAQGQQQLALDTLVYALELPQASAYMRTFLDEGGQLGQLLGELLNKDRLPQHGHNVLAAYQPTVAEKRETTRPTTSADLAGALIEPLTDRELEVLQLIARGLSNKEIAARLHLSTGTVKVHAHNIYGKLGVNGRTQAIARASELDIL